MPMAFSHGLLLLYCRYVCVSDDLYRDVQCLWRSHMGYCCCIVGTFVSLMICTGTSMPMAFSHGLLLLYCRYVCVSDDLYGDVQCLWRSHMVYCCCIAGTFVSLMICTGTFSAYGVLTWFIVVVL